MSRNSKIKMLRSIVVEECFCDFETFCENVLDTDGKEVFNEKFAKCNTREDLINLVNEYI